MDLVACQMAAKALYDQNKTPGSPEWDELPANNQASQITAVMRVAQAYTVARIEKRIERAKLSRIARGTQVHSRRDHGH